MGSICAYGKMRAYMMGEWPADADHHQKLSPTAATVGPGGQE